jgi:hypothetical protein
MVDAVVETDVQCNAVCRSCDEVCQSHASCAGALQVVTVTVAASQRSAVLLTPRGKGLVAWQARRGRMRVTQRQGRSAVDAVDL